MPRGNPQNLINLKDRSPEERREIAKRGKVASDRAKAEKKSLREYIQAILDCKVKVDRVDITIAEDLARKVIKAMRENPNIKDFKTLCEVVGELKPERESDGAQVVINVNSDGVQKEDIEKLL